MKTALVFLLVLAVPALSQTPTGASPYDRAGNLYAEVIAAYLGGNQCSGRSVEVVRLQRQLATTLDRVKPSDGEKVMLYAVTANSLSQVRRFNTAGAPRTGDNGSLLHVAARFADAPMLDFLIGIGLGIEDHGGASASALFTAATSGRKDNVSWLLRRGANVNAVDTQGSSALRHSLVCKDQAVADLLILAGAKPDEKTREIAAKQGVRL
jgi:ankyrin repeat protein